jgi:hypothetical protein
MILKKLKESIWCGFFHLFEDFEITKTGGSFILKYFEN